MQLCDWFVLLAASLVISSAQEIPDECKQRPEGNPKECCSFPARDKEKFQQCLSDMKDDKQGCPSDCMFGSDVFVDGDINRDNLMLAINEHFESAPAFNELHDPAVDHCIEVRAKIIEKFGGKMRDGNKCDRSKGGFAMCLHRYYFNNCPDDAWENSDKCNAWKSFSNNCSLFNRGKPRH